MFSKPLQLKADGPLHAGEHVLLFLPIFLIVEYKGFDKEPLSGGRVVELTTIICNLKWLRIEDCCSKFIQIIYYLRYLLFY